MTAGADPYLRGAQAVWRTIYRGRRSLTGEPLTWDDLPDTDKAACMAIARPVVDAVATLYLGSSVGPDNAEPLFPSQRCQPCDEPDLFGGES